MVIKRNFQKLYQKSLDPWRTGDAKAPMYNKVLEIIRDSKKEKFQNVLDLGCGAGYWINRLNDNIAKTIGIDISEEFILKARENYSDLEFYKMDFHKLEFLDNSFDCVYADDVLEHSPYPQKVLAEIYRILTDKGYFVALIPPDARNSRFSNDSHIWKTDKDEIYERLKEVGFLDIIIEDVDIVKKFGMAPYPASFNSMLIIQCWKR